MTSFSKKAIEYNGRFAHTVVRGDEISGSQEKNKILKREKKSNMLFEALTNHVFLIFSGGKCNYHKTLPKKNFFSLLE